jgi:NDP-sugar pyrophosphorylase family protein
MKTIIMAGGKGTRISSINNTVPKPMLEICGKPILEWQILNLKKCGLTDILIVIGHLGNVIKDYFGDGSKFGVSIEYFTEDKPLGTAGSLFKLKLEDDFLLMCGDLIIDIDFNRFIEFHKSNNALATLLTHPNDHPYDSSIIVTENNHHRVIKWLNKEDERLYYKNRVNSGIEIISPLLLKQVNIKTNKIDLDREVLKPNISSGKIYSYDTSEYIKDIGTPQRFTEVENDIKNGIVCSRNLKNKQKAIFLDRDGTINKYVGFLNKVEQLEHKEEIYEHEEQENIQEENKIEQNQEINQEDQQIIEDYPLEQEVNKNNQYEEINTDIKPNEENINQINEQEIVNDNNNNILEDNNIEHIEENNEQKEKIIEGEEKQEEIEEHIQQEEENINNQNEEEHYEENQNQIINEQENIENQQIENGEENYHEKEEQYHEEVPQAINEQEKEVEQIEKDEEKNMEQEQHYEENQENIKQEQEQENIENLEEIHQEQNNEEHQDFSEQEQEKENEQENKQVIQENGEEKGQDNLEQKENIEIKENVQFEEKVQEQENAEINNNLNDGENNIEQKQQSNEKEKVNILENKYLENIDNQETPMELDIEKLEQRLDNIMNQKLQDGNIKINEVIQKNTDINIVEDDANVHIEIKEQIEQNIPEQNGVNIEQVNEVLTSQEKSPNVFISGEENVESEEHFEDNHENLEQENEGENVEEEHNDNNEEENYEENNGEYVEEQEERDTLQKTITENIGNDVMQVPEFLLAYYNEENFCDYEP